MQQEQPLAAIENQQQALDALDAMNQELDKHQARERDAAIENLRALVALLREIYQDQEDLLGRTETAKPRDIPAFAPMQLELAAKLIDAANQAGEIATVLPITARDLMGDTVSGREVVLEATELLLAAADLGNRAQQSLLRPEQAAAISQQSQALMQLDDAIVKLETVLMDQERKRNQEKIAQLRKLLDAMALQQRALHDELTVKMSDPVA